MVLSTFKEFSEFLEQVKINVDDYMLDDSPQLDYPKQAGRMWYENTNLWSVVFSDGHLKPAQKYLEKKYFDKAADTRLFTECFIPLYEMGKMKKKYVMDYFYKADHRKLDMESILFQSIGEKRGLFRELLTFYQKNHIKLERSDCYGNLENGSGLITAISKGSKRITNLLLSNGADPNMREGLPLLIAVKNGYYTIALDLLKHGANIHDRNDLIYKTFLKNEDKRWCPAGEEQSHNTLLLAFKNAECKSGREKVNNG